MGETARARITAGDGSNEVDPLDALTIIERDWRAGGRLTAAEVRARQSGCVRWCRIIVAKSNADDMTPIAAYVASPPSPDPAEANASASAP